GGDETWMLLPGIGAVHYPSAAQHRIRMGSPIPRASFDVHARPANRPGPHHHASKARAMTRAPAWGSGRVGSRREALLGCLPAHAEGRTDDRPRVARRARGTHRLAQFPLRA